MAGPSSLIYRLDLSMNYAEFNLALNRRGYVGMQVCPSVAAEKQYANFRRVNAGHWKRPVQTSARGPNGEYRKVDFQWDQDSYATTEHGLEHPIDDRNRKIYADMIDQGAVSAMVIEDVLLTEYEQAVATLCQTAANNGTTYIAGKDTGGSGTNYPWSNFANAIPETDILQMVTGIENASGMTPNTIVIPSLTLRNLRQCTSIISQVKYSGLSKPTLPADVMIEILKEMTGLPNVLVASGFNNTAAEGQTAAFTRLWDSTKVWVGRADAGMGQLSAPVLRFANTIQWSEEAAANQADGELGLFFEEYRTENVRGEVMRGRTDYQLKIMHANAAGLITGC